MIRPSLGTRACGGFLASLSFLFLGCGTPGDEAVTPAMEAEMVAELLGVLADYEGVTVRWDAEAMDRFWGDSDRFLMAGDGVIMGGHAEWSEERAGTAARLGQFLAFEFNNPHVAPLSPNAASVTTEFEYSLVWADGDTLRHRGVWTYVFLRDGAGWDVLHSNGTHVEF